MADDKPIIVVKKKGGHGGHHGGAWKIAYADFVTAMMCFFMVMWLVNSASVQTRQNIASYFRKPGIFNEGSGTPLLMGGAGILEDAFIPPRPDEKKIKQKASKPAALRKGGEADIDLDKNYMQEGNKPPIKGKGPDKVSGLNSDKKQLEEIKKQIEIKRLAENAQQELLGKLSLPDITSILGSLDVKVSEDGLKIEIADTDKNSMFESGSSVIKPVAQTALSKITEVLKKYPNTLDIVGHTDGKPFPTRTGSYTNWELSADRANAARRLIESQGFPSDQIGSVIGKAAQDLKYPEEPLAVGNRRISLHVKFHVTDTMNMDSSNPDTGKLEDILNLPTPTPTPVVITTPTVTPTATPQPFIKETRILRDVREQKKMIQLPDEPPPVSNPGYMEKDKIFQNKPVVGPAELFSGID